MFKIIIIFFVFLFSVCSYGTEEHKESLLKSSYSWEGTPYEHYPVGNPQLSLLKVSLNPKEVLNWHMHPCISVVHMIKGSVTLTIKDKGIEKTFNEGDSFSDTVNIVHKGKAGSDGAVMLVFFACNKEKPLTISNY